jgi:hypothetical protein
MTQIVLLVLRVSFLLIVLITQVEANDVIKLIQSSTFKNSKTFQYLPIDSKTLQLELPLCPEILSPHMRNIGRQAMENLLICHALRESGKYNKIQYIVSGNTDRQKLDLINNKADMLGHTTFKDALNKKIFFSDEDFIISPAVIKKEQINWSLYTTDNQIDYVKKALSTGKLKELVGVSMLSWRSNISVMKKLKLKHLKKITNPDHIFTILKRKRAHFTLAASNKKTINRGGKLYRVGGL